MLIVTTILLNCVHISLALCQWNINSLTSIEKYREKALPINIFPTFYIDGNLPWRFAFSSIQLR